MIFTSPLQFAPFTAPPLGVLPASANPLFGVGSAPPRGTGPVRLALGHATVVPGQATTVRGTGCPAGQPVFLTIRGRPVGSATANGQGAFTALITPSVEKAGQVMVTADCGTTQMTSLLAVVVSSSVATPAGTTAAVFAVFVLLALVLIRGQYSSSATRRRKRRGAADVLDSEQP
ncbi:MAG: hypothetical protein WB765_20465 [Acidimicrobiales bacterium]